MGRFRHRPLEVEAVRYPGPLDESHLHFDERPQWLEDALNGVEFQPGSIWRGKFPNARVGTFGAPITAAPGDWIIRRETGELDVCKPEVFAELYEPAE